MTKVSWDQGGRRVRMVKNATDAGPGWATSVSLGEPDPGLFATPDYPEMTVRELSDTLLLRTGRAIADDAGLARLDRIHRNRPA